MSKAIQALLIKPGGEPTRVAMVNKLENYQKVVGGYIETVRLHDIMGPTNIIAIVNEEGRLRSLPLCGYMEFGGGDILVGPVLFVRENGDEFTSLLGADYLTIENCFGRYEHDEYDQ